MRFSLLMIPLYKEVELSFDTIKFVNEEIIQVQVWINANKLSLSVEKTNFLILSKRANKENVSLTLYDNNISRVTDHKLLGVMNDEALKFNVHINKACTVRCRKQ